MDIVALHWLRAYSVWGCHLLASPVYENKFWHKDKASMDKRERYIFSYDRCVVCVCAGNEYRSDDLIDKALTKAFVSQLKQRAVFAVQ